MTKLSIITPVYIDTPIKVDWLNQLYTSITQQTFKEWEWIIINDSSVLPLPEFENKKVRVLNSVGRQGPSLLRNTAVALALGEALLPLDSDDMLPNSDTLEIMYRTWEADKTKFVYGNVQQYQVFNEGEGFQKGKIWDLPEYTFDNSLNMKGTIPVSALHSKECHYKAGGWKKEFDFGLEDIEYWISAGLAGCCGNKINTTTLLYRKHDNSRTTNLRNLGKESTMRNKIIEYHKNVFEGERPMGCCGGNRTTKTIPVTKQAVSASYSTDSFNPETDVWVEYLGGRTGSFGITGQSTQRKYEIKGTGFVFPVDKRDVRIFERMGRGKDFNVNAVPPKEHKTELPVEEYKAPEVELGMIEKLDEVAIKSTTFEPEEVKVESLNLVNFHFDLKPLNLTAKATELLQEDSWTIEALADATEEEIMAYKGIGRNTAMKAIKNAKDYLSNL